MYSPYYNDDDRLKKVTEALLPYAKTQTLAEVEQKQLWKQVFGKAPFNTGKYVLLCTTFLENCATGCDQFNVDM